MPRGKATGRSLSSSPLGGPRRSTSSSPVGEPRGELQWCPSTSTLGGPGGLCPSPLWAEPGVSFVLPPYVGVCGALRVCTLGEGALCPSRSARCGRWCPAHAPVTGDSDTGRSGSLELGWGFPSTSRCDRVHGGRHRSHLPPTTHTPSSPSWLRGSRVSGPRAQSSARLCLLHSALTPTFFPLHSAHPAPPPCSTSLSPLL